MIPRIWILLVLAVSLTPVEGWGQKKARRLPANGTVFHVSDARPTWATCDVEFRDPSEALWPNFFYGKPAGPGTFTFDARLPRAQFALRCDHRVQKEGDQSRRVLGELLKKNPSAAVLLTVKAMASFKSETVVEGKKKRVRESAPTELVLTVGDREVKAAGRTTVQWQYGKGAETPGAVYLDIRFHVRPAELGVRNVSGSIECRAGVTAYENLPEAKKKK